MSSINHAQGIFCCSAAVPTESFNGVKLYNDRNREVHSVLFRSFIGFACRRQQHLDVVKMIQEHPELRGELIPSLSQLAASKSTYLPNSRIGPLFTPEVLEDLRTNPLTAQTPYVIHLTSRLDYGPVESHRYFVCPEGLNEIDQDWKEITLIQWFAQGYPFGMKAEKWDLKCENHNKFFRLTLRPNLNQRPIFQVPVSPPKPQITQGQVLEIDGMIIS